MEILIALFSLLATLVITIVALVVTALATLVPIAITAFAIWYAVKHGNGIVVSGPLVDAMVAQGAAASVPKLNLVKVGSCKACGAPRSTPSASAYVHCDQCGQLTDWDFKAAMADGRSKAPGPAYEALLKRAQRGLAAAKEAGDRDRYEEIQRELWTEYARACPAACPPRVGDEVYRTKWVAWTAHAQTLQDLDEACAATLTAQQEATNGLQWDRSNPLQPKATPESFYRLMDAVIAHQQQVVTTLETNDLLSTHPDRPDGDVFRSIGVAALVQGWLPFLPPTEHQPLLERAGLDGEYIEPPEVDLTDGSCPSCTAPLHVPASAKRVVCIACGHGVSVGGGTLPCLGCGASIEIPPEADDVVCTYCDTHVRRIGMG